ncbi:hypothetical protein J6590_094961 [Homalodisca vitripennis]|nr:hypothetical protein J6590_094961 [Homalodisca vitripennis]
MAESDSESLIKKARVSGTEYTNYGGKVVAARSTGNDCKCKFKCFEQFKDEDFISVLQVFASFKDKDGQDIYLQSQIERSDVQKRRNSGKTRTDCMSEAHSSTNAMLTKRVIAAELIVYKRTGEYSIKLLTSQSVATHSYRATATLVCASPGMVTVREFIDSDLTKHTFNLKSGQLPEPPATLSYPGGKIAINIKKINDLKKLEPYLVGYEFFYKDIFDWPTCQEEARDDS